MSEILTRTPKYLYRSPLSLESVGVDMPAAEDHPNRSPFTAVLSRVEEPSTRPPNGSDGHLVYLKRSAVEKALPSLIGMGVDVSDDFADHAKRTKIGVITEAHIDGKDLVISGHLFEKDFEREVDYIRKNKHKIGASYEISSVEVDNTREPIWKINSLIFTGAALLFKDKAAYSQTSVIAANADLDPHVLLDELYSLYIKDIRKKIHMLARTTHQRRLARWTKS